MYKKKRDHYTLSSAVRGPDHTGPIARALKQTITSRVRAILYPRHAVPGVYNARPMTRADLDALRARLLVAAQPRKDWRALSHVRDHLALAIECSEGHPVWGGLESVLIRFLQSRYPLPKRTPKGGS